MGLDPPRRLSPSPAAGITRGDSALLPCDAVSMQPARANSRGPLGSAGSLCSTPSPLSCSSGLRYVPDLPPEKQAPLFLSWHIVRMEENQILATIANLGWHQSRTVAMGSHPSPWAQFTFPTDYFGPHSGDCLVFRGHLPCRGWEFRPVVQLSTARTCSAWLVPRVHRLFDCCPYWSPAARVPFNPWGQGGTCGSLRTWRLGRASLMLLWAPSTSGEF